MLWKAGLYGRVSTDHEEQQESIKVQKEALIQYANDNKIEIAGYYFDEGYSGINFNRPQITCLKNDIDDKKVDIVIIKDLSRIGRNNSMTLLFLDYLAERNIRLISINDNYDTFRDEDDLVGIKTWFNELYSKELSKKIKFALRHKKKKGEYLTPYAPFGYKKSSLIKNKLEIDYVAADIVKEIFNLYINGYGFMKIASILQQRGISNPSQYGDYSRKSDKWDWTTVKRIISNPVYTGDSVQQRYCKKTFKSKSICKTPVSDWIKVENTHEPIISDDVYSLAQQIINKRGNKIKYRAGPRKPHLFTSFLYCGECGYSMYYKKDKNNQGGYRCGQYVKYGKKYCSSHFIGEEELKIIIFNELNSIIDNCIDYNTLLNDITKFEFHNNYDSLNKEFKYYEKQISINKNKVETLYKDKLNGIINDDLFVKLKFEMEYLLKDMEKRRNDLLTNIDCAKNDYNKNTGVIESFINIAGLFKNLDRDILERFVEYIEISESGDIFINFNFIVS